MTGPRPSFNKTLPTLGPRLVAPRAFTLIELLIVVAIIAILAAIAVPNLLEAQTRAKASRARADMRTIATALETYAVDHVKYPPNERRLAAIPPQLSTPIAYLASTALVDPFSDKESHPVHGDLGRFYTYNRILTLAEFQSELAAGIIVPAEAADTPWLNHGALRKYGAWRLVSVGPDRRYVDPVRFAASDPILLGSDVPYDPSNGTVSWGNIHRTHRSPEGLVFP